MAASNLNLGKASGGVLNVQPADGTTTTSLVLPAINGTVVAADSNGNVGIGVTPVNGEKLQVKTGANRNLGISDQTTITGAVTIEGIDDTRGFNIPLEVRGSTVSITRPTGTTAIFDASGNLGVSVTPATRLDVNGVSRIRRQNVLDTYLDIIVSDINVNYSGYDPDGYMSHQWSSNGSTKMLLSGSGVLTTPYQPSFRSYASSYNGSTGIFYSWATSNGQGSTYTYYRNIGGHFNTSTGTFTAPIAGRYLITAMYDNSTGAVERNIGWLYYNGSNIGEWVESYGQYDNSAGSIVLYLNANDTIQFGTHPGIPYSSIVAGIDLLG